MYLLKTNDPKDLTGKAAQLFAMFPPQISPPEPLMLMTASPGMVGVQAEAIGFFRSHQDLDFPMLAAIRLLAARHLDAQACIDFNDGLLRAAGLAEDDLAALPGPVEGNPGGGFTPEQRALIAFALKTLRAPKSVSAADVDDLRAMGWTDSTIYDAAAHAASMQVPATMMAAFKR
ncbi:MAG: hypothetical protein RDU24_10900 [Humidesulfovibrio sp.]|uniref:carboxymuconolactone decarboxylase family protein n=1 Tax=Humidesulfovibrio sp. TaxID=2910988 RepID=UPI0027E6A258|nr:hypothetical protein [Humidesulfovibrio sp.]MDQ7835878.1 hypothetical protein [Humidesulfovibrio sp.]